MPDSRPTPERRARALMGVVAASALAYPLLVCAVQLVFAQLLTVDVAAIVGWLGGGRGGGGGARAALQRRRRRRRPLGRGPAGPQPVVAARPRATGPLRAVADVATAH